MPELNVLRNGHLKLDYWEWKDFFAQLGCPILPGGPEASGREGWGTGWCCGAQEFAPVLPSVRLAD